MAPKIGPNTWRWPAGPRAGEASGEVMSASGVVRSASMAKKRSGSELPTAQSSSKRPRTPRPRWSGRVWRWRIPCLAFNIQTVCMSTISRKVAVVEGRADGTGAVRGHPHGPAAAARAAVRRARLRGGGHRGDRAARAGHARRALPPLRATSATSSAPSTRQTEAELAATIGGADRPTSPATPSRRSVTGVRTFLDACTDPPWPASRCWTRPSVLGWQEWREIDERYGLGLVTAGLQGAMDAGTLRRSR